MLALSVAATRAVASSLQQHGIHTGFVTGMFALRRADMIAKVINQCLMLWRVAMLGPALVAACHGREALLAHAPMTLAALLPIA
jgi:hypothetical protein